MRDLHIRRAGSGTPVVCVHGSGDSGKTWVALADLVPGYQLIAPDRPNRGSSLQVDRSDLQSEAADVVELLGSGAHLVGHSYGGVLALLAATQSPDKVLSLAIIEPPAFQLAPESAEAQLFMRRLSPLYPPPPEMKPQEWNDRWLEALGLPPDAATLSREEERVVVAMMREQAPWEASIDLEKLRDNAFPKVVFSGGWSEGFSAVCEVIASKANALWFDYPGAGHRLSDPERAWLSELQEVWRQTS